MYACKKCGVYAGIVVFKTENGTSEILDIAVKPEYQNCGIGRKLVDFVLSQFSVDCMIAETDDDAVGFYRKCGFTVTLAGEVYGSKRYFCKLHTVFNK